MRIHRTDSFGWPEALALFGGEDALLASAVKYRALVRKREVASAGDLLRLALMYGPGGHSLRMAAALAEAANVATLSDVALMKRVAGAAGWLEALCNEKLAALNRATPERQQGNATRNATDYLRIRDATIIPGHGQASSYRLHLSYDPGSARIVDFAVMPKSEAESLTQIEPASGDLVIADRAYPRPVAIRAMRDKGCALLLRLTWKSLRLQDADGRIIDWHQLLNQARTAVIDKPVDIVRARGKFEPLRMRLVILPKPEHAAEKARKMARREAQRAQTKTHDARSQGAASCLILLTTLAPEQATPERLKDLYAVRWQIELAFKRMKSILDMTRLPAKNPKLARAWLYAHLLIALLADDIRNAADAIPP